ncbi:hypothetical protein BLA60_31645 [Actinophytocola xinjiangensis]|uniref:Uncharacterized protein n=1 Tax=Actinophytocola xinjiangensis TaxID=485602 RepID=A0A7Z0WG66_9PSEU|nr:hypothetical protein [Actinophytocola xinjiangensis]OLF06520.1 hypothetical protein BLA60_31645 [Actinophytocola xinjiangensis]
MANRELSRHQHSDTPDPVLFGTDPFAGQPESDWDDDEPTYGPRPRWPVIALIVIVVTMMVAAMGVYVF